MIEGDRERGTVGPAERVFILLGGIAAALTIIGISTVLPLIDAALAHDAGQRMLVKLLLPISGLAMVAGAPMAGFMVERAGLRRFLLINCIAYAVCGTAGLWLSDLHLLLASRLLLGLFAASIATTAIIIVNTRLEGVERAKWTGLHVSVATLGAMVLFPVLGALGELGWRWPFAAYGVVGAGLGVAALFVSDGRAPARAAGASGERMPVARWLPVGLLLLALLIGGLNTLSAVYLSFVIRELGSHASAATAMVMMGSSVVSALASGLFGKVARVLDWRRIFVIAFVVSGTGFAVLAMARTLPLVAFGAIVSGGAIGWFVPNLLSACAQRTEPALQSRVTGIIKGALYVAQPLAVVLLEPVSRAFGPHGPFGVAALAGLVMVVWFAAGAALAGRKSAAKPA